MLLYRSGLRISEALALKPSDVDLSRHTCRVLHGKGDKATVRGFHPTATDALARSREAALDYAAGARSHLDAEPHREELEALTYAVVDRAN